MQSLTETSTLFSKMKHNKTGQIVQTSIMLSSTLPSSVLTGLKTTSSVQTPSSPPLHLPDLQTSLILLFLLLLSSYLLIFLCCSRSPLWQECARPRIQPSLLSRAWSSQLLGFSRNEEWFSRAEMGWTLDDNSGRIHINSDTAKYWDMDDTGSVDRVSQSSEEMDMLWMDKLLVIDKS